MNQRQLSVQTIVCTADDILMLDAGRGNSSIYVSNMVLQVTDCIADHLLRILGFCLLCVYLLQFELNLKWNLGKVLVVFHALALIRHRTSSVRAPPNKCTLVWVCYKEFITTGTTAYVCYILIFFSLTNARTYRCHVLFLCNLYTSYAGFEIV